MHIRRATAADHEVLVDIWLRSVRATHTFLSESDIQSLYPLVRDHALNELELWVLELDGSASIGFMGLSGNKLEAIFLVPEYIGRGGGTLLVAHAQRLKGPLLVDVNEQNPGAVEFYESLGFFVEARSELDGAGRPFPLLHMRQIVDGPPRAAGAATETDLDGP